MENLKSRTQNFALSVIRLVQKIQFNLISNVICKQLVRCGTSVGANYRSASRAKSKSDFIYKLAIAQEEADECGYWLELLKSVEKSYDEDINILIEEANQITAILTASSKKAKASVSKALDSLT